MESDSIECCKVVRVVSVVSVGQDDSKIQSAFSAFAKGEFRFSPIRSESGSIRSVSQSQRVREMQAQRRAWRPD
jgi:hypothetical protein